MERKIGEIFEYNGEWYQCVEGNDCANCVFIDYCKSHSKEERDSAIGLCVSFDRNDGMHVIFKKLEKVGEPFTSVGKLYQHYKVFDIDNVYGDVFWCVHNYKVKTLTIEIKQNKEDMEEKKVKLDKLVTDYTSNKITYNEFEKAVKELYADKEESKPSLKSFSLEAAKQGKPVCTRDGRKARIICFDRISGDDYYKIVACVTAFDGDFEEVLFYGIDGYIVDSQNPKDEDLMMLPEKKEGWAVIRRSDIYKTEEQAKEVLLNSRVGVMIRKIEWEE